MAEQGQIRISGKNQIWDIPNIGDDILGAIACHDVRIAIIAKFNNIFSEKESLKSKLTKTSLLNNKNSNVLLHRLIYLSQI